jgi:hypothetical protein
MTKPLRWADTETRVHIAHVVHVAMPVEVLLSLDPRSMLDRNYLRRKLDSIKDVSVTLEGTFDMDEDTWDRLIKVPLDPSSEEGWVESPDDRESEEDFTARVDAMNEEYPL